MIFNKIFNTIFKTFITKLLIIFSILSLPVSVTASSFWDIFWSNTPTESKAVQINKFKQTYKLIFVYTSTCGYCHRFAPNLAAFVKEYNLEIESLTANGGKIDGFTNAEYDQKRINELSIRYFPAVIVQNKNKPNETYTLVSGYLSKGELKNKFSELLDYLY